MGKHNEEYLFHNWFVKNQPEGFYQIKSEVGLIKPLVFMDREIQERLMTGENLKYGKNIFGRIDLIFKNKRTDYVCEIKYEPYKNDDFFDAAKVVFYCTYYNWVTENFHKPAVMMPKNRIKLEHIMIANRLDVALFGIIKLKDTYEIKKIEAYEDIR